MKISIELDVKREIEGIMSLIPNTILTLNPCDKDEEGCVCFHLEDEVYHVEVKELMEAVSLLC